RHCSNRCQTQIRSFVSAAEVRFTVNSRGSLACKRTSAAWPHTERGNLAAPGSDVGQTCGAEARKESGKFALKQIRREIDEHVLELDGGVLLGGTRADVGEYFATNGDALLDDPASGISAGFRGGHTLFDGRVPSLFGHFPAQGYARAAVLVARL